VNIFPRFDLGYDRMTEKGIDQLTDGMRISAWIGYGIRNRWETWGSPDDPQMGEAARTFAIYSYTLTYGYLFWQNHNMVLRLRYKGGVDNDFLTRRDSAARSITLISMSSTGLRSTPSA
jgi:hypothetical protein